MESRRVAILAASPVLADALRHLVRTLEHPAPQIADGPPSAGDIVVAPAADCSPSCCAEYAAMGAHVVVLASFPRDSERETYRRAGAAAYVTMAVGTGELRAAISALLPGEEAKPCAASTGG